MYTLLCTKLVHIERGQKHCRASNICRGFPLALSNTRFEKWHYTVETTRRISFAASCAKDQSVLCMRGPFSEWYGAEHYLAQNRYLRYRTLRNFNVILIVFARSRCWDKYLTPHHSLDDLRRLLCAPKKKNVCSSAFPPTTRWPTRTLYGSHPSNDEA